MRQPDSHLANFQLHDVRCYPIVYLDSIAMPKQHAQQWVKEMNQLLALQQPFVLVFLNSIEDDLHEDKKARMQWIKQNKKALARLCYGFIAIEPNKATRAMKRLQGAAIGAAMGLKMKFSASLAEAETLAECLLRGEDASDSDGQ